MIDINKINWIKKEKKNLIKMVFSSAMIPIIIQISLKQKKLASGEDQIKR